MKVSELQTIKQRYNIVGNCDELNRALDVALQVAPTDMSVLIIGESGVGKEIIPRVIHDSSPRRREKYFAINCGSIPEGTIDSELFGHIKGSFTGAINDSPGYFGVADKGTLFLDEVGELPMATQARLLRVLETGEYIPVGSTEVRKTDVRIVAATNVNVTKAISERRFRKDLYYRLNSICIHMPPLRDRGEDIVLLFRLFALQMAEKYCMEKVTLTDDAKALLLKYKWPGNVRQLKNITEQISVLSQQRVIDADVLSKFIPSDGESMQLATTHTTTSDGSHSFEQEREFLYKILFELRGNVNELRSQIEEIKKQLPNGGSSESGESKEIGNMLPLEHTNMPVRIDHAGFPTHLQSSQPIIIQSESKPMVEEADAEEYMEETKGKNSQFKEKENLNLDDISKQMIEKALERNGGNRRKAARELGVSDRTVYRKVKQYGLMLAMAFLLVACKVSFTFNGASIDYTKTKTIQIADFPVRSSYVWGPMASIFNNQLKDIFANHTKLSQVKRNGDLKIEGEITRYEQRNKSVSSEGYSAQTELSMTVNVRFTNNTNHAEDFEKQFTATSSYETTQSLNSVQEELVTQMSKEITDQIFNATVANW